MYGMTTHDDIKANEAGYALEAVFEVIKYEEDLHPDTRKFAKWIDYNTMEKPFECFAHFNENFAMRDEVRRELQFEGYTRLPEFNQVVLFSDHLRHESLIPQTTDQPDSLVANFIYKSS